MLPSSRPTTTQQHAHRAQFPSIIRTRSQQGRPLPPVDMYASPFKSAVRNHNHSTSQKTAESQTENMIFRDMTTHDETLLSSPRKKRASSPSFTNNDNAGKRTRILAQSSKINSPSRKHSEASLNTTHRDTSVTPSRAVSDSSPGKGLIQVDLTTVPLSPSKLTGSPNKTLAIIKEDGCAVRVPTTPVRRPVTEESEVGTTSRQSCHHQSAGKEQSPTRTQDSAALKVQPTTPIKHPSTFSLPGLKLSPIPTLEGDAKHCQTHNQNIMPSIYIQSPSTPVGSEHPAKSPYNAGFPSHISSQGFTPKNRPTMPSTSLGVPQSSPSKSRIPVPSNTSSSRLPRHPSSLSIPTFPVAGPSSPIKAPCRPSPVKCEKQTKGKVKSGIRARPPMTRLALKRGLQRASSSFTGLRAPASVGSDVPLTPSDSIEPSTANAVACAATERKSLVTSSLLSSENAIPEGFPTCLPAKSSLGSPKKPTSLNALSTALRKLTTAPPTAPIPRPRPNTGLGFAPPSLILSQSQPSLRTDGQDDGHVDTAPGACGLELTKASGHSQPDKTNAGLGKMGLPLRRPTLADNIKKSTPWAGAPFASKQTTLSTVLASPARSQVPTEADESSVAGDKILDVDAWVPSALLDKQKDNRHAETTQLEYLVPLTDEPLGKRQQGALDLVSPSRRASQASLLLSQSLSLSRVPAAHPPARSASASAVKLNPRTPVKTRGRTRPTREAPQPATDGRTAMKPDDPMGGKRSNARMPGSLDVLKDCVIFVDVRTEEGEDAAALFIDMLRGLGARILAKPGKSCTHLVYKAGLPSTITKYKLLAEPRPLTVSIGWVVECVEKRAHVDETRFLVNLGEIGVAGGIQRRRSMQPKQMRTLTLGQLDNGDSADISVRADSSFTSEEPSTTGLILANLSPSTRSPNDHLPPLERARQRSFRMPQE